MTVEMHPQRWGDPALAAPLDGPARALVDAVFGLRPAEAVEGRPPASVLTDAALADLRSALGAEHVLTDDATRALRTRGKSTPDLLLARAGDLGDAPDAVVRPADHDDAVAVLELAARHGLAVVPFGGGTSVVGGLARPGGERGVLSLDLGRMTRLLDVDPVSMTATLEPGLRGPQAEALLAEHGLTLGHHPQSFEHATIGGFAATRSSGQASAGYGRFDAMVQALVVATPRGTLRLGRGPGSAAGPDLRQLVLGSEGALGVVTAVTVRVRRQPEVVEHAAWRWPSFDAGAEAVRALAQEGWLPTVLRLGDEAETALDLADPDAVGGPGRDGCLMITRYEGSARSVAARRDVAERILAEHGGTPLGPEPAEAWARGRYRAPYLRDSLLDVGVLVETLETATTWSGRAALHAAVGDALRTALPGALVLCHVSHVYETGCSLYFTVAADADRETWLTAKSAATDVVVRAGATITHHHGVGRDHAPWLPDEIGTLGVEVLRAAKGALDPDGLLNPGVLGL